MQFLLVQEQASHHVASTSFRQPVVSPDTRKTFSLIPYYGNYSDLHHLNQWCKFEHLGTDPCFLGIGLGTSTSSMSCFQPTPGKTFYPPSPTSETSLLPLPFPSHNAQAHCVGQTSCTGLPDSQVCVDMSYSTFGIGPLNWLGLRSKGHIRPITYLFIWK